MKNLILLTLLIITLSAQSYDGNQRMNHARSEHGFSNRQIFSPQLLEKIEATGEQIDKINSIQLSVKKEMIQLEADIKLLVLEKKELMSANEIDLKEVEKKIKSISVLKANIEIKKVRQFIMIKKVFSGEQIKKLKELRNQRSKAEKRYHKKKRN